MNNGGADNLPRPERDKKGDAMSNDCITCFNQLFNPETDCKDLHLCDVCYWKTLFLVPVERVKRESGKG
jgi:hypothetical protein